MEWINIHSSVLSSPEFVLASDTERGTWLCLLAFCCTQENSGRIAGAKKWPLAAWPQMCRVSAKTVLRPSSLWSWEGEDLIVNGYSVQKEQHVKQARGIAMAGAMKRWGNAGPDAARNAERHSERDAGNGSDGNAEGKGREGKNKGREEEGAPASATASASSIPEHPVFPFTGHIDDSSSKRSRKGPKTPDELGEPMASRLLRVGALLRRRASTPWKVEELEAFRAMRLDVCTDEEFHADLLALEGYYSLPLPAERDYRRRELLTLLRNWPDDVSKARNRATEERQRTDPDGLGAAS